MGGSHKGRVVDVVHIAGVGRAVRLALGDLLAGDVVRPVFVGAAVGCRDLLGNLLGRVGGIGQVEGRAGLRGVDGADLPSADHGCPSAPLALDRNVRPCPKGRS